MGRSYTIAELEKKAASPTGWQTGQLGPNHTAPQCAADDTCQERTLNAAAAFIENDLIECLAAAGSIHAGLFGPSPCEDGPQCPDPSGLDACLMRIRNKSQSLMGILREIYRRQ
jgi:hypothetical protein